MTRARKQKPTILRLSFSFRSRLSTSASTDILQSSTVPEVTSIKLSIPKPTSEMLTANAPATKATRPSRLFQAIVKYSRRFPRSATPWRSSAISTMDRNSLRSVPSQRWSSVFQCPMRRKWGKIPTLFRHTLHQLNDHREQTIPGLNSHSGTSDIANHDVDTSSRRSEIDRRHGAKLWRPFFVRHPLPFRFRHFRIRFRCLHRRFVDPLDKRMNTHGGRNTHLDLIPHPLSYGGEVEILPAYGIAV